MVKNACASHHGPGNNTGRSTINDSKPSGAFSRFMQLNSLCPLAWLWATLQIEGLHVKMRLARAKQRDGHERHSGKSDDSRCFSVSLMARVCARTEPTLPKLRVGPSTSGRAV